MYTFRSAPFLFLSHCLRPHNRFDFELQQLRRQVRKPTRCVGLLQIPSPQDLRCSCVLRVPGMTCDEFSAVIDALYICSRTFCVTARRSKLFAMAVPCSFTCSSCLREALHPHPLFHDLTGLQVSRFRRWPRGSSSNNFTKIQHSCNECGF